MLKILVVDDESPVRDMVMAMIGPTNYDLIEAGNGVEAIEICERTHVDLIITDIVMPNKNGIDLIMEVKAKYPEIPVIAISGGGGVTGRFDYLEISKLIGADNILKKPFELQELRDAVSDAVKK